MSEYISKDYMESLGGKCIAYRDEATREVKPVGSLHVMPTIELETDDYFGIAVTNQACRNCKIKELELREFPTYSIHCIHQAACRRLIGLKGEANDVHGNKV